MNRLTIETISPIHIGTGVELTPFDYHIESGQSDKVAVIDCAKLFREPGIDPEKLTQQLERVKYKKGIGEILKRHNIRAPKVAQYILETTAERSILPTPIKEQIKDITNRPYIPGSEIKGAMRTGIIWWKLNKSTNLLKEVKRELEKKLAIVEKKLGDEWGKRDDTLKSFERELANDLENLLLGEDPKKQIFKALSVGDTSSVRTSKMQIFEIGTENLTQKGALTPMQKFRNYVEGISPGVKTSCKCKIDGSFWKLDIRNHLEFEDKKNLLLKLPSIMREYGLKMAKKELDFYKSTSFIPGIKFYQEEIIDCELNNDQFFLPLGWGAGQHLKTVLDMLDSDRIRFLFSLRDVPETRLGSIVCKKHPTQKLGPDKKSPLRFFCYECMKENRNANLGPEDVKFLPYSKTRRFVFENGEPRYPLGWVKITVTE